MAVQILAALAAANIAAIGYAVSSRTAFPLVVGSAILIVGAVLHRQVRRWMTPYFLWAAQFEKQATGLDATPTEAFGQFFLRRTYGKHREHTLRDIQDAELANIDPVRIPWLPLHLGSYMLLWLAAILQLATVPFLVVVFGFRVL